MGPDDALRLADWTGGLFPEVTPTQVAYLADEFAAFDVAVVEHEVTRYRRHYESLNVANLLRRVNDAQTKRGLHAPAPTERQQVEAQWQRDDAALSNLTDAELRRHKDAILDENPNLRAFLGNKDPRASLVLRSLIVEHRLRPGAAR